MNIKWKQTVKRGTYSSSLTLILCMGYLKCQQKKMDLGYLPCPLCTEYREIWANFVFVGSKLDAKVVETWRCPDQRSHRVPDADGQELTISGNSPAYRKTIVDTKRSSGFVPPEAVASIQLLVIAVGCSILFIVIVCCFLYYRVKSRWSMFCISLFVSCRKWWLNLMFCCISINVHKVVKLWCYQSLCTITFE